MANRLVKLADATYAPGIPYQPAVPAYCVQIPVVTPGYWEYPGTAQWVVDPLTGQGQTFYSYTPKWVPSKTRYQQICYPAQPEVLGVAPVTTYTPIHGWNGGANSIAPLVGNGVFSFQVRDGAIGVVAGLSRSNDSSLPSEQEHAWYIHGEQVDVMESGVVVASCPLPHTGSRRYQIVRIGGTVNYSVDGWSYTSAKKSTGTRVLDASLYASGDYVENPRLGTVENIGARGLAGALGGTGRKISGRELSGATGLVYMNEDGAEIDLVRLRAPAGAVGSVLLEIEEVIAGRALSGAVGRGRMAYEGGDPDVEGRVVGSFQGVLPPLDGILSEQPYGQLSGSLPMITGYFEGGFPQVELASLYAVLPALSGVMVGMVGVIGRMEGTLPPLVGKLADAPYAEMSGTLPALTGTLLPASPIPDTYDWDDGLMILEGMLPEAVVFVVLTDQLGLGDDFDLMIVAEQDLFDYLGIGDDISLEQFVELMLSSGLALSADTAIARREALQYVTNAVTGAPGRYSGFDFQGFARTSRHTYGFKADGVYRIGDGDEPLDWSLDFGQTDFGTAQAKILSALYIGLASDGEVYARLQGDDGSGQLYRLVDRGDVMHTLTARGVSARRWNLRLEATEATAADLDMVEFVVSAVSRRWRR